jgi:hypothetical protein
MALAAVKNSAYATRRVPWIDGYPFCQRKKRKSSLDIRYVGMVYSNREEAKQMDHVTESNDLSCHTGGSEHRCDSIGLERGRQAVVGTPFEKLCDRKAPRRRPGCHSRIDDYDEQADQIIFG